MIFTTYEVFSVRYSSAFLRKVFRTRIRMEEPSAAIFTFTMFWVSGWLPLGRLLSSLVLLKEKKFTLQEIVTCLHIEHGVCSESLASVERSCSVYCLNGFFLSFLLSKIMTHSAKIYFCTVTVRLLEPGHLEEYCPVTTFFEEKRFLIFFYKRTKFKVQPCNR